MQEKKQKTLHYSPVSNDAFITSYFLIIFITITLLVSIETTNLLYHNKMLKNLKIANTYQAYEAKVLQVLNHNVLEEKEEDTEEDNEQIEEEIEQIEDTLSIDFLTFHYIKNDSTITVDILSPIEESLVIYLENEQIYDYDVVRYTED